MTYESETSTGRRQGVRSRPGAQAMPIEVVLVWTRTTNKGGEDYRVHGSRPTNHSCAGTEIVVPVPGARELGLGGVSRARADTAKGSGAPMAAVELVKRVTTRRVGVVVHVVERKVHSRQ
jgi:hypothetical protein